MIKRVAGLFIILFVVFAFVPAYSQVYEFKEYTVSLGDTLWSISLKELIDPFLWPMIWKENPEIKHPDLIYPGQKIRIPTYLLQKQIIPQIKKEPESVKKPELEKTVELPVEAKKEEKEVTEGTKSEPKQKEEIIEIGMQASTGYVADILDSKGEIAGSPTERVLLGKGDYAYVTTVNETKNGDKFYIIRSLGEVKHPDTGDFMGYLIEITGVAEVVGEESGYTKVRIITSFTEVLIGDILNDYYEIKEEHLPLNPRTPDVAGFVVAARQRRIINADHDIVYIDKGRNHRIEIGDLLGTISTGKYTISSGVVQVIGLRDATSTAIVRKCDKEIKSGDKIGSALSRR
ncbi:MAG: LysM peptidoglycan-binding domain-containing protein [Nitrospirota bacterium]